MVRVVETVEGRPVYVLLHTPDRQVAGLEQQCLGRHVVHVELRQQGGAGAEPFEVRGGEAALDERVHQEFRCGGLEPVRAEPAAAEQLEDAERVVHRFPAQPVVAVVPLADPVPVQARQLRGEHGVQIGIGIAADRRVVRVQGQVGEVVEVGEQTDLRELAHPGDEGELHVGVAGLERAVQPAQVVAVGPRPVRLVQRVQDRLVVLVHEHHDAPAGAFVQRLEQAAEAHRGAAVMGADAGPPADVVELRRRALLEQAALPEVAAAEVQTHHRVAPRPVPAAVVHGEVAEERLAALEQLL